MGLDTASVTITLAQLDELRAAKATAEAALETERQRRLSVERGDPGGRVDVLAKALGVTMEIVQFAVGNLHPLTVRGWPYSALYRLAFAIREGLPSCSYSTDLAHTFERFGEECRKWEEARAEGREKELLAEENAAYAPSPALLARLGLIPPPMLDGAPSPAAVVFCGHMDASLGICSRLLGHDGEHSYA